MDSVDLALDVQMVEFHADFTQIYGSLPVQPIFWRFFGSAAVPPLWKKLNAPDLMAPEPEEEATP